MTDAFELDENLLEFATEREAEYLKAVNEHGGQRAAARVLGCAQSAISRAMGRLKVRAAMRGYSPDHDYTEAAPVSHTMKGVSTLYKTDPETGEKRVALQWTKSELSKERQFEIMKEAIAGLVEDVDRLAPVKAPKLVIDDLLNLYTMTDCHMGMLSWPKETGEAWDIEIAERVLWGGFKAMIDASPAAAACVINQLGDFLHSDGMLPITPTSGHILDQDGRFAKVVAATIRVLRKMISYALEKHEHVHVIMAEGNHDITSSIWLRQLFTAIYENEPRVTVDDSECPYYVYQHGKVMLGFHHGHKNKPDQLPGYFAAQHPTIWGETRFRYGHLGHFHHLYSKDFNGMRVTQHPTLAARDAYASRGGYVAPREATAITYHREYGQVGSYTVTPEMLL